EPGRRRLGRACSLGPVSESGGRPIPRALCRDRRWTSIAAGSDDAGAQGKLPSLPSRLAISPAWPLRNAPVIGRPLNRCHEEALHFPDDLWGKSLLLLAHLQYVPPCRQVVQPHAGTFQPFRSIGENIVV